MPDPIVVTATDPESGETQTVRLEPGQYVVTCAEPMYLDSKQVYGNGTVVLTLKRRTLTGEDTTDAH